MSPIGFAILSGAGLFKGKDAEKVHVHMSSVAIMDTAGKIDLSNALAPNEGICDTAPIFAVEAESDGSIKGNLIGGITTDTPNSDNLIKGLTADRSGETSPEQKHVFVDFYVTKNAAKVSELQIDAENFAGYYYVEASTLFRRQNDGVDMPAELTFPNVKIQSNFTFTMASTGDPSTFTFTMDALPGYTYFNPTRKVLCAMQIIEEDEEGSVSEVSSVFPHEDGDSDPNSIGTNNDSRQPTNKAAGASTKESTTAYSTLGV